MLDALTKSAKGLLDKNCTSPFYSGVLVETAPTPAPQPATEPAATPENGTGEIQPGPESKDPPQVQVD